MRYGQDFVVGGPAHWAALGMISAICLAVAGAGLRVQRWEERDRRRFEAALASGLVLIWCMLQGRYLLPDRLRWDWSLPLQICNVVALLAPLAVWNRSAYARAILYHVGLGICPVALVLPVLHAGFARPDYWIFWSYHGGIIVAAVYDRVARHYRPTWRDWQRTAATILIFSPTVLAVDLLVKGDYAFLGNNPHPSAFARAFGPWPWRDLRIVMSALCTTALVGGLGRCSIRSAISRFAMKLASAVMPNSPGSADPRPDSRARVQTPDVELLRGAA